MTYKAILCEIITVYATQGIIVTWLKKNPEGEESLTKFPYVRNIPINRKMHITNCVHEYRNDYNDPYSYFEFGFWKMKLDYWIIISLMSEVHAQHSSFFCMNILILNVIRICFDVLFCFQNLILTISNSTNSF